MATCSPKKLQPVNSTTAAATTLLDMYEAYHTEVLPTSDAFTGGWIWGLAGRNRDFGHQQRTEATQHAPHSSAAAFGEEAFDAGELFVEGGAKGAGARRFA